MLGVKCFKKVKFFVPSLSHFYSFQLNGLLFKIILLQDWQNLVENHSI